MCTLGSCTRRQALWSIQTRLPLPSAFHCPVYFQFGWRAVSNGMLKYLQGPQKPPFWNLYILRHAHADQRCNPPGRCPAWFLPRTTVTAKKKKLQLCTRDSLKNGLVNKVKRRPFYEIQWNRYHTGWLVQISSVIHIIDTFNDFNKAKQTLYNTSAYKFPQFRAFQLSGLVVDSALHYFSLGYWDDSKYHTPFQTCDSCMQTHRSALETTCLRKTFPQSMAASLNGT